MNLKQIEMKETVSKFAKIRNLGIKSVLAFIGLGIVASVFYPFVLSKFYLTDRDAPIWNNTDWILSAVGFFLAVGGAYYNVISEKIANKFSFKSNKNESRHD